MREFDRVLPYIEVRLKPINNSFRFLYRILFHSIKFINTKFIIYSLKIIGLIKEKNYRYRNIKRNIKYKVNRNK